MNSNKFYEDYEKLKTVGQGAFGTATLYRRINDGKQVVMKEVFLMDMDNSEKKAALNEVEILATLNHPNIIKYLGSFQKEGSLVIVMEYADGGNLTQLINAKKNKNENFTEKSILNIVSQISAAISYMHSNKILHRDLKSANIFLNMNGNVKVGDFGISKMLNTRSQAQTVVGTPYYLSPEMCEGSDYNEKSDIWALGCILYELACLRKPFEAMTLPVLVQKITNCEYQEIPDTYSEELSQLVHAILQKNSVKRPSAKHIFDSILPKIAKRNEALQPSSSSSFTISVSKDRSVLYKIFNFGDDQKIIPQELPHKKIIDFSVSATHYLVVFSDHSVYSWGENTSGQLGLGHTSRSKSYPTQIIFLNDKKIIGCCAGKDFSLFLTEEGSLFSCGDGQFGCLGHGDWNSILTPKIIDSIKSINIKQICCGDEHVVALTNDGKVLTWGSSKSGQLGQGHTQFRCTPLAIKLLNLIKVKNIFCGEKESALLTINGQVLVSGSNNYYKLGIQQQENVNLFTPIIFNEKIKFVSIGVNHTMMLTETGGIIGIGRNSEGQLGKQNYINYSHPQKIRMKNKIMMIACGLNFTVAVDNKNVLWFWGSAYRSYKNVNVQKNAKSNSVLPLGTNTQDETIILKDFNFEEAVEEVEADNVKVPKPILAFYSSPNNIKSGSTVKAANIKINGNNLFVLAHTTAPPPIKEFTKWVVNDSNSVSQIESSTKTQIALTNLPNMV